mgnify:FL=1
MKDNVKNIFKLIISFVLFFNLSLVIACIFKLVGINYSDFNYIDYACLNTFIELIMFVVVLLFYKKYLKKDLVLFKLNKKDYIKKIISYFLIFLVVKYGVALFSSLLLVMLGSDLVTSENQEAVVNLAKTLPFMMMISTSLLAPFVEEGIFRLGIKKVINNKYLFILVSGLIFGFMHIFPTELPIYVALIESLNYVTMGLLLAYIYNETDNIYVVVIIHALNNLLSMLMILATM